jgi:4'-phosphopantetheinyl transferase
MPSKSILNPNTLQLWFASVSDATLDEEQKVLEQFSYTEFSRLNEITSRRKRREYLLSRALMRHALWQHFQPRAGTWQFVERCGATPLISNLPKGFHFSLSHSDGLICFAITDCAIGIDIETFNRQRDFSAVAEAFMNDEELAQMEQSESIQADYFYRIWCAKEAYFKMLPATEQKTTLLRQISYSKLTQDSAEWELIEGKTETCRFAAVMHRKPRTINQSCFVSANDWSHSFSGLEID